jgi:hypothetical protein
MRNNTKKRTGRKIRKVRKTGKARKTTKRIYGGQATIPNINDLQSLVNIYLDCKEKTENDINLAMNKEVRLGDATAEQAGERGRLLNQIAHEKFEGIEAIMLEIDGRLVNKTTETITEEDLKVLLEQLTELITNISDYTLFRPQSEQIIYFISESYFYDIRTNYLEAFKKMLNITKRLLLQYTK